MTFKLICQPLKLFAASKKYLKNRSESNRLALSKQCNYYVNLLRKTKRECYRGFIGKDVINNKNFWKTIKYLFPDKIKSSEKIGLAECEKVVANDKENADIYSTKVFKKQ